MKKTKRILSLLLVLAMMFSLLAVNFVSAADEDVELCSSCGSACEWKDESAYGCQVTRGLYCVNADCSEDRILGETVYRHNYVQYARVNPTCIAPGAIYSACENSGCYSTIVEEIPADSTTHSYGEWVVSQEPACNEEGSRYAVCNNSATDADGNTIYCNDVKTEAIPADDNAHVYEGEWITRTVPSCDVNGEAYRICTVCNNAEETKVLPAHSATWKEYDRDEATCAAEGKAYYVCKICNTNCTEILPVNDNHIWYKKAETATDTDVYKAPTCTEEGYQKYVCRWHHDVEKTEVLEMTDHIASDEWTTVVEATCQSEGEEAVLCKTCDKAFETRTVAKTSHTLSKWILEGTCETGGTATRTCVYCKNVMSTTSFSANTHLNRQLVTVAATCVKDGYTADWCPDCGYTWQKDIIAASHSLSDIWTVTKKATCTEEGIRIKQCENCDYFVQESIEMVKHTYLITDEGLPATCLTDGYSERGFCLECGKEVASTVLPATGHNDANNDGCCDKCYVYFVETDGGVVDCDCFCHNQDGLAKFVFKIYNFICQLFGTNQSCACGKVHYEGNGLFGGLFG